MLERLLERRLERLVDTAGDATSLRYRRAVVVSGHMVDAPDRETVRFPPEAVPVVAGELGRVLAAIGVGAGDVLICGGACGTDLIAAELALGRGADVELLLAQPEEGFIRGSVLRAGDDEWLGRFREVVRRAHVLVQDDELGPPAGNDRYQRNNVWMLDRATTITDRAPEAVVVWNGEEGDGPGGTAAFVELARSRRIEVRVIDLARIVTPPSR